ncbi:MAG TPA: hypothetical protein VGA16_04975 [Candidatus Limnocylindria bacterium]
MTTNGTTFAGGTVAMTNVAGTVVSGTNCSSETTSGTCAVIFNATAMKPGAADRTNTVAIAYTGTLATSDFRLFATAYTSKDAASSALCTAADPASKLNVQVKQGTTIVFPTSGTGYGTLAAFATTYTSTTNGLQLKGGANGSGTAGVWAASDSSTFTINVNLDTTADDPYQGCKSVATIAWYAAQ